MKKVDSKACAACFIHPSKYNKDYRVFFEDKGTKANPFWQQGADEGWFIGPMNVTQGTAFVFKGSEEGPAPPTKPGTGMSVYYGAFPKGQDQDYFNAIFCSEDVDKFEKGYGVYWSVGAIVEKGGTQSSFKGRQECAVYHFHENVRSAKKFSDSFVDRPTDLHPQADIVADFGPFDTEAWEIRNDFILDA